MRFFLPLLLFLTFLTTNICAKNETLIETTLQLAWKHQWQFAGYYMAKEKSFYKDAGLNVNIKEFDLNVNLTDDILEGRADFGVGHSSLIYDRAKGKPVVMLNAIFQHSPVILLAKKRKDLKTVYDLKNKRIMLTKDQIGMASINAMLYSNGIQPGMYKRQEHTFNVNDLIEDKTDALLAYISNEPYAMQEKGIDYKVFSPKDYNFDFYSDILFTSDKLLKTNPALVEKFTQASLQGWEYAIKHPDEATALILKKYNTQKRTKGALSFESKAIIKLTDYGLIPLGNINQKRIEYITQIYRLMGLIKGNFSLDNFIYNVKLKKKKNDIGLSESEVKWIKSNVVKIGVEQWAPVVYSNTGKDIDGIAGDFMKLIIERTGLRTTVVNDKWDTLLNEFKEKKIDILPATYYTDERATYGHYSKGYFKMKDYLYVKENTKGLTSLDDMHGKTLAIVKGYGTIDKIKKTYPDIKILLTDSLGSSIDAVLQRKADALYEGGVAVEYFMKKELISGLKGFPQSKFKTPELYFFTLPEKQILSSIIQKGLQSITPEESRKIISKWHMKNDNKQLQSQKVEIGIGDILPIKEILIATIVIAIIIFVMLRYLKRKQNISLGIPVFIFVSIFLVLTIIITFLAIKNLETVTKREVQNSLQTVMNITDASLTEWFTSQKHANDYISNSSVLLEDIYKLVQHKEDETYLLNNQKNIKQYYKNMKEHFRNKESFFIVADDFTLLSASNEKLIGKKLAYKDMQQAVSNAFEKGFSFLMPQKISSETNQFFRDVYILTVLRDKSTNIPLAVIGTGINPKTMFQISNKGRIGKSGETYLVNKYAQLISNSRFDDELRELGLIKEDENSFLNIEVKYNGEFTTAFDNASKKQSGVNLDGYKDYRGIDVFGTWRWDENLGIALISEIDREDAMRSFVKLRTTIFAVVFSIVGFTILLMVFILWFSNRNKKILESKNRELEEFSKSLEQKVEDRTKDLTEEKKLFQGLFDAAPDGIVLISQEGRFEDCNKASISLFGVESREELLGSNPAILSPEFQLDGKKSAEMMKEKIGLAMQRGKAHFEWLHMRPKNQETFFAEVVLAPFMYQGKGLIYAIVRDISDRKEAENKLADSELFVRTLLDSQDQIIITTDGKELLTANRRFFKFFDINTIEKFIEVYDAKCICNTFNTNAPEGYLQIKMGRETWIDYVISRPFNTTHKAMITMGSTDFIFSVTAAKLPGKDGIKSAVFTDITAMENAKQEIEAIHKNTKESIEYASLIQGALIPDNKTFRNHFQDYFAIWHPKDTIGGDIYLFEELRQKEECLLMVIDCTGHGVPGAFVTMLVKAIERQITAKINNSDEIVSPAKILSTFNQNMKQLLKQESIDSLSNAGFDGGIIYYNKKEKVLKFAGAETPLFYIEEDELKMIKGNRYSVGYKKCDMDYEYKEHTIEIKEGMQFYLTTDGYLDQNGGEKSFPFGKKSFRQTIEQCSHESMSNQRDIFLKKLAKYQANEERNDDVTVIGFKI